MPTSQQQSIRPICVCLLPAYQVLEMELVLGQLPHHPAVVAAAAVEC